MLFDHASDGSWRFYLETELRLSWFRRFEEPIELPDGRKLKTLAEAMAWLAKEIPKSENKMEKVQTAAHLVTQAAAAHGGIAARPHEGRGPLGWHSPKLLRRGAEVSNLIDSHTIRPECEGLKWRGF